MLNSNSNSTHAKQNPAVTCRGEASLWLAREDGQEASEAISQVRYHPPPYLCTHLHPIDEDGSKAGSNSKVIALVNHGEGGEEKSKRRSKQSLWQAFNSTVPTTSPTLTSPHLDRESSPEDEGAKGKTQEDVAASFPDHQGPLQVPTCPG